MKNILFLFAVIVFTSLAEVKSQSIKGKYRFVADSDGKEASAKSIITLQFLDNTFKLKAEQPGNIVTDEGTYQISGSKITISFKTMEQGKKTGNFSFQNGTLTLPFKMLNNIAGSSTWLSTSIVSPNTSTKKQVIDNALAGSVTKAKLYKEVDNRASKSAATLKGGLAEAYYIQAMMYYFRNLKWESLYGFAKASQLQETNGLYLNNFSNLLLELGRIYDAKVLTEELTKKFPNLASPWANQAYIYLKLGIAKEAEEAIQKAIQLAPDNGLYYYTAAKIAEERGNKKEAENLTNKAWQLGYAGNGREASAANTNTNANNASPVKSNNVNPNNKNATKPTAAKKPPTGYKLVDWQGNYRAKNISARSGENATDANTKFGAGMATTIINLQTLACVKNFSMQISASGNITGSGEIMYVYQGNAANAVAGMMPSAYSYNGFSTYIKDGFQIRQWSFTGTVTDDGRVEIHGLPSEKLDLRNVNEWQKITPWSPLPPDAAGAAMKGPFHLQLSMSDKKEPFIYIDQSLALNDKLIKKVHYTGLIVKTNENITPVCTTFEPPAPEKCPATESIKTKIAISSKDYIFIDNSNTYTKGADGKMNTQSETKLASPKEVSTGVSVGVEAGMLSGGAEFNTDGSYEFSVGVGMDANLFGKDSPIKISEKFELIYDSKCGWGARGTVGAGGGGIAEASVQGVIFFNKGL
jgi:tetratricopeptide (TPR) repeat protein